MEIALEGPQLPELITQAIQIAGILLSLMVAWVLKWAKAHFESKIMRDNMDRLNDTIQNGISVAVTQGQEIYAGTVEGHKTKAAVINQAMVYTREHSAGLIKVSGYSTDKIRDLIESKIPQIQARLLPVILRDEDQKPNQAES